tara:strand:+ start:8599 stop:10341 length:1743 start_codon:yes stop_codon:yes gene_type:complete
MESLVLFLRKGLWVFVLGGLLVSFWVGRTIEPTYILESITLDVMTDHQGYYYVYKDQPTYVDDIIEQDDSQLLLFQNSDWQLKPQITKEVIKVYTSSGDSVFQLLTLKKHWSFWSLLPAILTLILCWLTQEPVTALLMGVGSGALILAKYNIIEDVLIASLMRESSATMILIYLFLLGGLLGIWAKTGAAKAFADWMTDNFVRGPRSAKLVTWVLGILFFQGGTMSVVLVGSTVKPLSDKENVSHEELSYIVDSTASPIASQLAFNSWPAYVQSFIYVSGVSFLVTQSDRVAFFFKSVPFCFYAIFAVLGTFLVAIEKPLFIGSKLKDAMHRSRETGQLDAEKAIPLSSFELQTTEVPTSYTSHFLEFVFPLFCLIGIAIGTFIMYGSPNISLAFGLTLIISFIMALMKGMGLLDVINGVMDGMKSLILGLVILLCAMMIGQITIQTGAGMYLTGILGQSIIYWMLPVILQIICVCMAFSTGTSWGTYAIVFPIAMPLAWAVAQYSGLAYPELFMTICFAAVMDGSVYGDQCSPISDTTVLTAMCTGCDLMDHVKTQLPQATFAAVLAGVCWTLVAFLFV